MNSDASQAVALPIATRTAPRLGWTTLVVLGLVIAVALAFVLSSYRLFQLTMVVVYAVAVLGLNLVTGYNGQISLGHGAFYAVGAYVAAILMANYDVPYWVTLAPAAVACAIVGFAVGLPALRLEGHYLALTTFALAVAIPQILKVNALSDWTGGVQGIVGVGKPEAPFGLPLNADQWLYLFTLAVAVALFVLGWNLVRGRIGRAMVAIRDHSLAAEAMGIDTAQVKTRTFAVSAMFAGVAGALGAIVVQYVAPDSFSFILSITLFVGLVVGGIASIAGAIWGALFIVFVPNWAGELSRGAPGAVYGALLIACLYVMPLGIAGLARGLPRHLRAWRGAGRLGLVRRGPDAAAPQ